jgi:hypothetical protein
MPGLIVRSQDLSVASAALSLCSSACHCYEFQRDAIGLVLTEGK